MRLISPTGPKVTRKSERKAKKRKREKKTEHSYVFISSTLDESYSLAGSDGQQRVHPRAEVISIVFINPGRYILLDSLLCIIAVYVYELCYCCIFIMLTYYVNILYES